MMPSRHSLRFRIGATFFVLVGGLSALFAWGVARTLDVVEHRYTESTLSQNLELIVTERRQSSKWALPRTRALRGYAIVDGDATGIPVQLSQLSPGFYEFDIGDNEYQVGVRDDGGARYILTYDTSDFDESEEFLESALVAGIVVFSLIGLWLGVWTADRILAPITSLAGQIGRLGQEIETTALDVQWGDDEVAELAKAFEHYMQKVQELIAREREFTANVSHELRNPIMVATSSIELLLARSDANDTTHQQLLRTLRALRQMTNLVDAFLILGRDFADTDAAPDALPVEPTLREIVEFRREAAALKKLELSLIVNATPSVSAPRTVISVVLDNLVGNALAHTNDGGVSVHLETDCVRISDTGPGIPEEERVKIFEREFRGADAGPGGTGLGLAIVQALCQRYGWRISIESELGTGTIAEVQFSP